MSNVKVTLRTGEVKTFHTVRIKVSGFVVCEGERGEGKIAYAPHMVEQIADPEDDPDGPGYGLKSQSPHGRI